MDLVSATVGIVMAVLLPRAIEARWPSRYDRAPRASRSGTGFPWTTWCVAHLLAGCVGGLASGVLRVTQIVTPGGLAIWIAFGVSCGIAQWLVLRHRIRLGAYYVTLGVLGWSTWGIVGALGAGPYLAWGSVGAIVGVLQWLALRQAFSGAALWIPANLFAWMIAGNLGVALDAALRGQNVLAEIAWLAAWSSIGLTGSVVLGIALAYQGTSQAGVDVID